jgi:hypothetical protein
MSSLELQRRSEAAAWKLRSVAAHPGWARTDLFVNGPRVSGLVGFGATLVAPIFSQSAEDGVLPILFAATSPHLEPGGYYGSSGIGELKGPLPDHASGKRSCCRSAALGVGRVADRRSPRIDLGPRRAPIRISRNASHDTGTGGQFDPIAVRIQNHRDARDFSERDRRQTLADTSFVVPHERRRFRSIANRLPTSPIWWPSNSHKR